MLAYAAMAALTVWGEDRAPDTPPIMAVMVMLFGFALLVGYFLFVWFDKPRKGDTSQGVSIDTRPVDELKVCLNAPAHKS